MSYFDDGTPLLAPINDHKGPIAQAVQDVAAVAVAAAKGWRRARKIYDSADYGLGLIPATPNAVIIDAEVEIGTTGRIATTDDWYQGWYIEKPDGAGGWTPTTLRATGKEILPGAPAVDSTPGYEVRWNILARPGKIMFPAPLGVPEAACPYMETRGERPGRDVNALEDDMVTPRVWLPADHGSRLRFIARRSSRVYTAEEQVTIDALGYRFRFVCYCPDYVEWEQILPIPATDGELMLNEVVDLGDHGLAADRAIWAFEFQRLVAGVWTPIRAHKSRESGAGEQYDSPTYPVRLWSIPEMPGAGAPWNEANEGAGTLNGAVLAYENVDPAANYNPALAAATHVSGTWIVRGDIGQCGWETIQRVRVMVWRDGARPTHYSDGSATMGSVPGMVPVGDVGETRLVLRLLTPAPDRNAVYPFGDALLPLDGRMDGVEAGLVLHASQIAALDARVAASQPDSVAADVATLRTDYNALLAALRAAGLMDPLP